jgi:hypothetical protein
MKIGQSRGSFLSIKTESLLKDGFVDSSSQVQESGSTDPNVVPYSYKISYLYKNVMIKSNQQTVFSTFNQNLIRLYPHGQFIKDYAKRLYRLFQSISPSYSVCHFNPAVPRLLQRVIASRVA